MPPNGRWQQRKDFMFNIHNITAVVNNIFFITFPFLLKSFQINKLNGLFPKGRMPGEFISRKPAYIYIPLEKFIGFHTAE